ncbi:CdaR family transcriptional regulator [Amycolatopsis sp. WQ 127309]|uniref:PucR family transcriptional regulator n=1 Tax=Amycolatopsis sp. WQ 127309 TaxID=2932773 RepID=UPI001FF306A1|nr:helix-turn-helix domain-containing protein [Amycolatopsis sp. WQ 127309]UOZ10214.1 helix-turn-helix domain-containing protein [Amycolatopsis sp. WQ 127309]
MTDDKAFRVGGQNLADRLTGALPALTRAVIEELVARLTAYRLMPGEELAGDISRVIEQNLRSFVGVLRSKTLPTAAEVAFLRESAARRAEEGIPIEVVLTAYHVGFQVTWDTTTADARPGDLADVMAVNALLLRYLELITPAVAAGYLAQQQSISGDEYSARQSLLAALLGGEPAQAAADQAGLRLPPSYLVVAFGFGAHPDETSADVDPLVAARRKLRRLRAELERQVREPMLTSLTTDGGLALLPERDRPWLDGVVREMARAAAVPVTAGVVVTEPDGVAAAAPCARRILAVARTFGRPPGVYRLDDVVLEYQLSCPSEARDRLAEMLEPLADKADLLDTLRAYLRLGDRRTTAAQLHVHPNTVDYRLRRVQALTGLDPTSTADVTLLGAAVVARAAD